MLLGIYGTFHIEPNILMHPCHMLGVVGVNASPYLVLWMVPW